jgi:hypothetical protein
MPWAVESATFNESIAPKQESVMTVANVVQRSACGLPQALKTAQEAIQLPEVQAMLRRLSEYNLGIFMPHQHDAHTGEFQPLPDEVMQVESGLKVSFLPVKELANQTNCLLPVGWLWRAGALTPVAACEMDGEEEPGAPGGYVKHKMPKRT